MKFLSFLIAGLFLFSSGLRSQDSLSSLSHSTIDSTKEQVVNADLKLLLPGAHKSYVTKGYLIKIQDSAMFLSHDRLMYDISNPMLQSMEKYDYKNIVSVKLINKRKATTAILISMGVGIIAGALIGYAQGDDDGWFAISAGEKAFLGGLIGGGVGSLTGLIIAKSNEKKFEINGEYKNLEEMKAMLR